MQKKIITHDLKFHADDVFAVASLKLLYPDAEVVRTRDEEVRQRGDFVLDTGDVYDPERNLFDHHQHGGAGERSNGVPYSSFGLVWKKYGEEICGAVEVAERMDNKLVQPIDGPDNGVSISTPLIPGVRPYYINGVVNSFRPTWKEGNDMDKGFFEALSWAINFLKREIKITQDSLEAEKIVIRNYENSTDKRLVIFEDEDVLNREVINSVLSNFPEPLYMVSLTTNKKAWKLLAINVQPGSFEIRKPLPESWRAKEGSEFDAASSVIGGNYCHKSGFICSAKTKEAAIELAKIALNS